jgi:hypothetical protein
MYSAYFLFTRLLERVLGSATPSTWRILTVGNNPLLPLQDHVLYCAFQQWLYRENDCCLEMIFIALESATREQWQERYFLETSSHETLQG